MDVTTLEDLKLAFDSLTGREVEVAKLLTRGLTNHEIAKELEVSVKTVDTHRMHVMKKLEMRNNVELTRAALKIGFATLD